LARLYNRLDEVKQKKEEEERVKRYAENRKKAKDYHQVTLQFHLFILSLYLRFFSVAVEIKVQNGEVSQARLEHKKTDQKSISIIFSFMTSCVYLIIGIFLTV